MINKYSYIIPRNEAKKMKIGNEDCSSLEFEKFIKSWKIIKNDAIKYENWEQMTPIELSKEDELIYFLIDDNESNYGLHIAAAYQSFIKWQNEFLEPIINENKKEDGILHFLNHNLENEINVQDAKDSNILNLDKINLENIIIQHTKRDIFKQDGTIDYSKYNSFIFDFDSIEKDLGEKLLYGISLFSKKLKFVSFWSEGNPEILTTFIEKYPQNSIDKENKIIIEYLKKIINNENVLKEFFGSFQLLFFYSNNNSIRNEETINSVISDIPNLPISNKFKKFFENEGKQFKINQSMNIFLYFEHLCFDKLCQNLDKKYKSEIDEKYTSIINKKKELIENNEFPKALRRYITRYLIGNNNSITNLENNNLSLELNKSDLWGINSGNMNQIKNFLIDTFKDIDIKVSQSLEFYKLVGSKEKNSIKQLIATFQTNNNHESEYKSDNEDKNPFQQNNNYESEDKSDNEDNNEIVYLNPKNRLSLYNKNPFQQNNNSNNLNVDNSNKKK